MYTLYREEKKASLFLRFKISANFTQKHEGKMRKTKIKKIQSQFLSIQNLNENFPKLVTYMCSYIVIYFLIDKFSYICWEYDTSGYEYISFIHKIRKTVTAMEGNLRATTFIEMSY